MTVRGVYASTEPGVQAGRTDISPFRRGVAHVLFLIVATACASPSAAPPSGIPAPAVPRTPAPSDVPSRWRIAVPTAPTGYTIESHAIVSTRADSLARTDTLDTRTDVRVVPRGAAIDLTVGAYVVRVGSAPAHELPGSVRAVGRYGAAGGITFEGAGQPNCTSMAQAAIEATRDLWVKWPADVGVGDRWRDSTSIQICRDSVPLQVTLSREYRVVAATGDSSARTITVERRSTMGLTGRGSIRGDSTVVTGEGSGTATLRVSATTGWVIDGQATSDLQLRARGTRRTQLVEQRVTLAFHQVESGR